MLSFPQPVDFAVWRQDAPIRRIEWRNKLVRPGAEAEKLAVSAIVRRIVSVRSPCWNCLFHTAANDPANCGRAVR